MLNFTHIGMCFASKKVLHDIQLNLEAHQTHVLLGESGCGKSTLVKLATGLLTPSSGQVALMGNDPLKFSPKERAQAIGYMPQNGGLFPHLTCLDNVLLPAKAHKQIDTELMSRLDELCELVSMPRTLLDRYPKTLSGGQRQRVALLRALILDPPILFLDEPLGALDPIVRSDLQAQLRKIFQRLKKTVVLVTHDLAEAAYFSDTITLLYQGNIEQHGEFEELMKTPKTDYIKEFLYAQRPPPRLTQFKEELK